MSSRELRRVADLGAASQALGPSDLSTTASIYGHDDLSDLERAMEAFARFGANEKSRPTERVSIDRLRIRLC